MNRVWTRSLRSVYRQEPISSFVLTIGAINALIGGTQSDQVLMLVGLSIVVAAIGLRWWINGQNNRKQRGQSFQAPPMRYLPDRSSHQSLPTLTAAKKRD